MPGPADPAAASAHAVALKETCRVAAGRIPLWPWHRARLAAGGVGAATLDAAEALAFEAAARWADAPTRRARLTLVVAPDRSATVDVSQRLSSLDVVHGLRVARVDLAAAAPPVPLPAAKPADRAFWDAAHRRAAALGADQAVLVAPDGSVVDGSTAAVWIAERGTLLTPPAAPEGSAIPSVSVAFVRAQAQAAGLDVRVERFSWERFEAADEAFFTNAFGGAAAVRGRGGELFGRVRGLFSAAWS